jgi:uncharacterized protein with GYD domain
MAKYLVEARYTAEGAKGLAREGGTGRRAAAAKAVEGLGGKVESFYYAFGDVDAYVIFDVPDNVSAAALSLAVGQSGGINTKTVVLITPEEKWIKPAKRLWTFGRLAVDRAAAPSTASHPLFLPMPPGCERRYSAANWIASVADLRRRPEKVPHKGPS